MIDGGCPLLRGNLADTGPLPCKTVIFDLSLAPSASFTITYIYTIKI